jgi:cell division septation protein DedD
MNPKFKPQHEFKEDDFLQEFESSERKLISNFSLIFILLLVIACGLSITWYYYSPKIDASKQILPLIKADNDPIKVKPVDPGGMVVLNMDKTIYDNLNSNNASVPKTEKFLPTPEQPIDRAIINGEQSELNENSNDETIYDSSKTHKEDKLDNSKFPINITKDIKDYSNNDNKKIIINNNQHKAEDVIITEKDILEQDVIHEKKSVANDNAPINLITNNDNKTSKKPAKLKNESKKIIAEINHKDLSSINLDESKVENLKSKKANTSKYRIQLASFKSQKEVNFEWNKIKKNNSKIIANHKYFIAKKEIAGKGLYYRLQLGSFDNEQDARLLCKKLSANKQSCFVLKPGQN